MSGPPEALVQWAARAVGGGVRVVGSSALKLKESQQTWLLAFSGGGSVSRAVLKTSPLSWYGGAMTESVALPLALSLGLPVPRLLGIDVSGELGVLAVLTSVLPGSSDRPASAPSRRLRGLGAAAARLHAVPLSPRPGLELNDRPVHYDPYIAERREGKARTTPLLDRADEVVSGLTPVVAETVLVHGDYHLANTMWEGDSFVGYIDWDTAGVGHPGVDLGWSRLDAALHYGLEAAEEILLGWRDAAGREPELVAYWDAMAALQNPAELGEFSDVRDAFLRSALDRLDRS